MTAFPKTPVQGATLTRPKFTWDGWDCVKEDDGTNVFRWYCPDGELYSFERNSTFYQVHIDALGSVRAITDNTGAVVGSFSYGAWGELLSTSEPSGFVMPFKWIGGYGVRHDPASGLYYMRNRWYDTGLGCFISREPKMTLESGRPSMELSNLYHYCYQNPLDYIDPMGDYPRVEWDDNYKKKEDAKRNKIKYKGMSPGLCMLFCYTVAPFLDDDLLIAGGYLAWRRYSHLLSTETAAKIAKFGKKAVPYIGVPLMIVAIKACLEKVCGINTKCNTEKLPDPKYPPGTTDRYWPEYNPLAPHPKGPYDDLYWPPPPGWTPPK